MKKLQQPTIEMTRFFQKRTEEHINRVRNNLTRIMNNNKFNLPKGKLLERWWTHDNTKYSPKQHVPYIWLTWFHKCKNDGLPFVYPYGVEDYVNEATENHVVSEKHHPEAHADPAMMAVVDIAEMVADWAAMSQELETSLKAWAKEQVNVKWKFNEQQTQLIWSLIDFLE